MVEFVLRVACFVAAFLIDDLGFFGKPIKRDIGSYVHPFHAPNKKWIWNEISKSFSK